MSLTGHRAQLLDRPVDRSRLAEDLTLERDHLVAADDRGVGSAATRLAALAWASVSARDRGSISSLFKDSSSHSGARQRNGTPRRSSKARR